MNDQKGFVSILVASVLLVLLSLVTLGFITVMQREQRQSIDRQLSTQAYYAAETAVNDVYNNLAIVATAKTTCDVNDPLFPWMNGGVINSSTPEVTYSCVKIDPNPTKLEFNNGSITTQNSKLFPVQALDTSPGDSDKIKTLTIGWTGSVSSNKTISACDSLLPLDLPATRPGEIPLLRLDLTRWDTSDSLSRAQITSNTTNVYLYPQAAGCGGATVDYGTLLGDSNRGQIIPVDCAPVNGDNSCSITITGMNGGTQSDRYFARVKSIYGDVNMYLTGTTTNNNPVPFVGAQVLVDATGKASDVLRRIQVHIDRTSSYPVPEYVFKAGDGACKIMEVIPPSTTKNANCY